MLPAPVQEVTDDVQGWLKPDENTAPASATTTIPDAPATPPVSSPNAEPGSGSADHSFVEELVQNKVNEFRATRSLPTLAWNGALGDVALAHSQDMAERGYFDHANPEGLRAQDRVERAGLTDFGCGENLFKVTDAKQDAAEYIASEAFTGWLNSPGHYENMIGPIYDTGGVGVFVESKLVVGDLVPRRYDIYVTHLLCEDTAEYQAAKHLYGALAARYERLKVEYEEIEKQFVKNTVPYSQVEAAFEKLQLARAQLNKQAELINDLLNR